MTNDDTLSLQRLIDRIHAGDVTARRELLNRACERLRKLAARMLHESFPALRQRHELDSVVHETWLRLVQAVEQTNPPTVADFFRLAAFKVRHVLLDMAERERKRQQREQLDGLSNESQSFDFGNHTYDPSRLAAWTEFHDAVAGLPEEERIIVEMHFYLGVTQSDIAKLLNLHPRRVSYLWVAATETLAEYLERVR